MINLRMSEGDKMVRAFKLGGPILQDVGLLRPSDAYVILRLLRDFIDSAMDAIKEAEEEDERNKQGESA